MVISSVGLMSRITQTDRRYLASGSCRHSKLLSTTFLLSESISDSDLGSMPRIINRPRSKQNLPLNADTQDSA